MSQTRSTRTTPAVPAAARGTGPGSPAAPKKSTARVPTAGPGAGPEPAAARTAVAGTATAVRRGTPADKASSDRRRAGTRARTPAPGPVPGRAPGRSPGRATGHPARPGGGASPFPHLDAVQSSTGWVEDLVGLVPTWRADAACTEASAAAFYPPALAETRTEREAREQVARDVCAACPARAACLAYALLVAEPYGIWGGATEIERRKLLRSCGSAPLTASTAAALASLLPAAAPPVTLAC